MPLTMSDYQNLLRKSTALRKIPDGSGLYLFVKGPGRGAYWTFQYRDPSRFSKNGKPAFTSRGLGPFPDVTPKRAREAAERVRVELREGVTIIRGGVVTAMPRQARAAVAGKPFSEAVERSGSPSLQLTGRLRQGLPRVARCSACLSPPSP